MNNDITLAKLIGSPKQIEWAETIRENAMWYAEIGGGSPERYALMARISTAKWWIDNRKSDMTLDMLKAAVADDEANAEEEKDACKRRAEYARYKENLLKGRIACHDIDGKLSH